MPKVEIRSQKISDAKRFFEILTNPNFLYLGTNVKSVAGEREWLRRNPQKRRENKEWNYAIIYGGQLVGAIGIKISQHRSYIGEIGYFLDEKYWGRGITTKAVRLVEGEAFKRLKLSRLEILMRPENKASERVAIKSGYRKEGRMRKAIKDRTGKIWDAWLYAKVLE